MKLLIIGTGVIGTLTAISLTPVNHQVSHQIHHYVRRQKLAECNGKQIRWDILDERLPKKIWQTFGTYHFQCTDTMSEDYDLIIAAVNSYQLIPLLTELNQQRPNARYLLMTLNWGGTAEIDAILKPEQYILGYASGGGTYRESGSLLWGNIGNDVLLGAAHDCQQPLLDRVKTLFTGCGITPEIPSNILHALWLHNISAAPFGVALARHGSLDRTISDKRLVQTCFKAMAECYQICQLRGVNLKDYPETRLCTLPFFILYPLFRRNLRGDAAQRYTAHALLALDEMKANFNEMLLSARQLAVATPNMDALQSYAAL